MASPGKSSDKTPQETGGSSAAGRGSSPDHPPRPEETENVPPPQQQVEGVDTLNVEQGAGAGSVAVTGTQATETIEVPAEQGQQRKRVRTETAGASGSGEKKQRKKGEFLEIPSKPPTCYVCGRAFQSWKAVFGHMRAHKVGEERARSGAFPPPVFTPPGGSPEREQKALQEQLVPTLLDIAQEVLARPQEVAAGSSSGAADVRLQIGSSSSRAEIDLNLTQEPSPAASEPTSPTKGCSNFDLNKPAPGNGGDDADNSGAV